MADGAAPRAKLGRVILEGLITSEGPENILNRVFIGVKFADVPTHILFKRIPEHVKLGAIRTQDGAILGHEMQPDWRIFKKVFQFLDRLMQSRRFVRGQQMRRFARESGETSPFSIIDEILYAHRDTIKAQL